MSTTPAEILLDARLARRKTKNATREKYLREWRQAESQAVALEGGPLGNPGSRRFCSQVKRYAQSQLVGGLSLKTLNRRLSLAKLICHESGSGHAHLIPLFKQDAPTPRALGEQDAQKILHELARLNPDAHEAFTLVLLTGLKLSEVVRSRFNARDIEARRLTVTERGRERVIVLGERAAAVLTRRLKEKRRWRRKLQTYSDWFLRAAVAAGIPDAGPMQLRYTYAARMLLAGHDPALVAHNLGIRPKTAQAVFPSVLVDYEN